MIIKVEEDFKIICNNILSEKKSLEEWAKIESDDMFQEGRFCGGFDANEGEFCFSVCLNEKEFWFQFSLNDAKKIILDEIQIIDIRISS